MDIEKACWISNSVTLNLSVLWMTNLRKVWDENCRALIQTRIIFGSGFRKIFFGSHTWNYIGKLKIIKWNRFDTGCKNEWVILTHCISSTDPCWKILCRSSGNSWETRKFSRDYSVCALTWPTLLIVVPYTKPCLHEWSSFTAVVVNAWKYSLLVKSMLLNRTLS